VMSGGSFESSNDFRLHYGLADNTKVDKVEIRWPDGKQEVVTLPGVDRYFAIEEGQGLVASVYDNIASTQHGLKAVPAHGGK